MISRRQFITQCLLITTGLAQSAWAKTPWQAERFSETAIKQTLQQLFPDAEFIRSKKIKFSRLPKVAENGAIVPITINTSLENISKISILVDNNPIPLSAEFYLSPLVEPRVSARLRMAKSGKVIVIIEADGQLYRKTKKVKVTQGGCGG